MVEVVLPKEASVSGSSPAINTTGDKDSYRFRINEFVTEVGGTVTLNFKNSTEATADVDTGLAELINVQVTALDVLNTLQEGAHVGLSDNGSFRIYGHTNGNYTGQMRVMWCAKGFK